MTLKDWKKAKQLTPTYIQYNNLKKRLYLGVYKQNYAYKKGSDWFVNVERGTGDRIGSMRLKTVLDKKFKTKSKALAYAKAYMRKH